MKRTPTAIVYVFLMIAAISTFFINYTNSYTSNIVRTLSFLTFVISVIGLFRLRKLK